MKVFWSHAGSILWPFSSSLQQSCLHFALSFLWIWLLLRLLLWCGFAHCFVHHGQREKVLHCRSPLLLKAHWEQGEDGNGTFSLVQRRGTTVPRQALRSQVACDGTSSYISNSWAVISSFRFLWGQLKTQEKVKIGSDTAKHSLVKGNFWGRTCNCWSFSLPSDSQPCLIQEICLPFNFLPEAGLNSLSCTHTSPSSQLQLLSISFLVLCALPARYPAHLLPPLASSTGTGRGASTEMTPIAAPW